jgi:hypothetical protein
MKTRNNTRAIAEQRTQATMKELLEAVFLCRPGASS